MNRPSSFDARLTAWLEEGPTTGPDDLLADVHARARSVRQRPGWWLALKGDTMTTTWRARPAPFSGRLAFILLTALLLLAIAAATVLVGSRPAAFSDGPATDGAMAVAPVIPTGDEALFAFTSWSSSDTAATCSSSGPMGPMVTTSHPTRSTTGPLHGRPMAAGLAFYSGDDDSVQLRVASADGISVLADAPGCWIRRPSHRPGRRTVVSSSTSRARNRATTSATSGTRTSTSCRQTAALRAAACSLSRTRSTRVNRPGRRAGSIFRASPPTTETIPGREWPLGRRV